MAKQMMSDKKRLSVPMSNKSEIYKRAKDLGLEDLFIHKTADEIISELLNLLEFATNNYADRCIVCGSLPRHLNHHWYESEDEALSYDRWVKGVITDEEYDAWCKVQGNHIVPVCPTCNNILKRENLKQAGYAVPVISGKPHKVSLLSHILPQWDIQFEYAKRWCESKGIEVFNGK